MDQHDTNQMVNRKATNDRSIGHRPLLASKDTLYTYIYKYKMNTRIMIKFVCWNK